MILLIDNYDSFTYNLYHYLIQAGESNVEVIRNDKITLNEIRRMNPDGIMISPGPASPDEAGICLDVIRELKGDYPIFGVCLGHQAIGQVFGGKVTKTHPMHGKVSTIYNNGSSVFSGLPGKFKVTRYHSLKIDENNFPDDELEITSQTKDGIIMGVKHKKYNIHGVQFHPESIASEHGHKMIENFLKLI